VLIGLIGIVHFVVFSIQIAQCRRLAIARRHPAYVRAGLKARTNLPVGDSRGQIDWTRCFHATK
jgi:hypothetical protein